MTHTCPTITLINMYLKTAQVDYRRLKDPVSLFFDDIMKKVKFKEWHFGHHHQDVELDMFRCHYRGNVFEIK